MKNIYSIARKLETMVKSQKTEDDRVAVLLNKYWPMVEMKNQGLTLRQFELLWKNVLSKIS